MLLRVRVADTASLLTLSERMLAAARVEGHDFDLLSKPVHPKDLINNLKGLVTEPSPISLEDAISADAKYGAI